MLAEKVEKKHLLHFICSICIHQNLKKINKKYVPLKFYMVINQPIFGATYLCNFSLQTLHKPNLAYVMLVYLCTVKKCVQIIISSTRTVTFSTRCKKSLD